MGLQFSVFEKDPPHSSGMDVLVPDWTKNFDPDVEIPGTVLIDPTIYGIPPEVQKGLVEIAVAQSLDRSPLIVGHEEYQHFLQKIRASGLASPATYGMITRYAHNEGTKFGNRKVIVVTPVMVDKDRFQGHESMLPYFVLEMDTQMGLLLKPRLDYRDTLGLYQPEVLIHGARGLFDDVSQRAKTQTMEATLSRGQLPAYTAFHDSLYDPDSADNAVQRQFLMRRRAEEEIASKYNQSLVALGDALLRLAGRQRPSTYQRWQQRQTKMGYVSPQMKL